MRSCYHPVAHLSWVQRRAAHPPNWGQRCPWQRCPGAPWGADATHAPHPPRWRWATSAARPCRQKRTCGSCCQPGHVCIARPRLHCKKRTPRGTPHLPFPGSRAVLSTHRTRPPAHAPHLPPRMPRCCRGAWRPPPWTSSPSTGPWHAFFQGLPFPLSPFPSSSRNPGHAHSPTGAPPSGAAGEPRCCHHGQRGRNSRRDAARQLPLHGKLGARGRKERRGGGKGREGKGFGGGGRVLWVT